MTATLERPPTAPTRPAIADSTPLAGRGDPTIAATIALTIVTLVVVAGMTRLFVDGSFFLPVAAVAVATHAVWWVGRRWDLPPVVVGLAVVVVTWLLIGWMVVPGSTAYGIPWAGALHDVRPTGTSPTWWRRRPSPTGSSSSA
jgi:hypothetical protein